MKKYLKDYLKIKGEFNDEKIVLVGKDKLLSLPSILGIPIIQEYGNGIFHVGPIISPRDLNMKLLDQRGQSEMKNSRHVVRLRMKKKKKDRRRRFLY